MNMTDKELQALLYHLSLIILNSVSFIFNVVILIIFINYRKRFFPKQTLLRRLQATRNHNKCLISMLVADILVGFFGTLTGILLKFVHSSIIYKLCGLIPLYGSMFVSTFALILLTMDRLFAVKYPFSYDSLMSNFRITLCIVLCWIIPIFTTISQMVIYVTEGSQLELKIRNTILTIVSLTGFVILLISNAILIKKVRQQSKRSDTLVDNLVDNPHHTGTIQQEKAMTDVLESGKSRACVSEFKKQKLEVSSDSSHSSVHRNKINKLSFSSGIDERESEHSYGQSKTIAFIKRADNSIPITMPQSTGRNTSISPQDSPDQSRDGKSVLPILSSLQQSNEQTTDIFKTNSQIMAYEVSEGHRRDKARSLRFSHKNRISGNCVSLPATKEAKSKGKVEKRIRDRKITMMCICIVVAFLICWLPLAGYRFSYVIGRTTSVPWFRRLTQCLAVSNSLFNPFIYFLIRDDLRELLKRLLRIGKQKSLTETETSFRSLHP